MIVAEADSSNFDTIKGDNYEWKTDRQTDSDTDSQTDTDTDYQIATSYANMYTRKVNQVGATGVEISQTGRKKSTLGDHMPLTGRSSSSKKMLITGRNISSTENEMPKTGRNIFSTGKEMLKTGRSISTIEDNLIHFGKNMSARYEMILSGRSISTSIFKPGGEVAGGEVTGGELTGGELTGGEITGEMPLTDNSAHNTEDHMATAGFNIFKTAGKMTKTRRTIPKPEGKKHISGAEDPEYICPKCDRDCHSHIGLFSHTRSCNFPPKLSTYVKQPCLFRERSDIHSSKLE